MQNTHNELGAVELLLLAGMAVLQAAAAVAIPLVALLLTLAGWRPTARPTRPAEPAPAPAAPAAAHPLAQLATTAAAALEPLTVAQLRRLARSAGLPRAISRNGRRAVLLQELTALQLTLA